MRGRPPKHPDQRRNRTPLTHQYVVLPAEGRKGRTPPLPDVPDHEFSAETKAWWREIWKSPMATQWLETDRYSLGLLAVLLDRFQQDPKPSLAAEIRIRANQWGLTPEGRRSLRWIIDEPESPDEEKDEVRQARLRRLEAIDTEQL